jgi:hypothetical protein
MSFFERPDRNDEEIKSFSISISISIALVLVLVLDNLGQFC